MNYQPCNNISLNFNMPKFEQTANLISTYLQKDAEFDTPINKDAWNELEKCDFWHLALSSSSNNRGWEAFADAVETLSKKTGDLGFSLSIVAHAGIIRMVELYGTKQQQAEFLPRLLTGETASMAITESSSGSDVPRIRTNVIFYGQSGRLNGAKAHITNAPDARIVLAVVRRDDLPEGKDIALCLIGTDREGVYQSETEKMLGHKGGSTGAFEFKDVKVTRNDFLRVDFDGLQSTYEMIAIDRALYGLAASHCIKPLFDDAMQFVKTRTSFGKTIGEHQLVQLRIVEAYKAMTTGNAVARSAITSFLTNQSDAVTQCSMAKYVCTEGYLAASRHLVSVMGHAGYERGNFSSSFCDAVGSCIAAGTNDIQVVNIFQSLQRKYSTKAEIDTPSTHPHRSHTAQPCLEKTDTIQSQY